MVDWNLPTKAAAEWARNHNYDLSYAGVKVTPEINALMQQEIARFVEEGVSLGELVDRLSKPEGPLTQKEAESVAVTETTRAYSEGNQREWAAGGIIDGKEWRTANDSYVCDTCRSLSGYVVPVDSLFLGRYKGPPAHEECRCWIVAVPLRNDQRIENGRVITVAKPPRPKHATNREEETAQESDDNPWWQFWKR